MVGLEACVIGVAGGHHCSGMAGSMRPALPCQLRCTPDGELAAQAALGLTLQDIWVARVTVACLQRNTQGVHWVRTDTQPPMHPSRTCDHPWQPG